jgi:hypothetical protein
MKALEVAVRHSEHSSQPWTSPASAVDHHEHPAQQMTMTPPATTIPSVCQICGEGETAQKQLCYFLPTAYEPEATVLHVFCGKIAAILPKINRPDLEILTKSGIKHKHGTGPCVLVALQRSRASKIPAEKNKREQCYYLVKEVEDHLNAVIYQRDHREYLLQQSQQSLHHAAEQGTGYVPKHTDPKPTEDLVLSQSEQSIQSPSEDSRTAEYSTPVYAAVTPASFSNSNMNSYYISPPSKVHLSPFEKYMERLQQVTEACGAVGYSLVRPVSRAVTEDDYAEEDSENFDPRRCSQAQVDHVRVILITETRQRKMEKMERLVAEVMDAWGVFSSKYRNLKSWEDKFDSLVSFSKALKGNHVWLNDENFQIMVTGIASLWKTLLPKSDAKLGIDGEFTRPGVMALLQEFQELVEAADPNIEFRYE